MLYKIKHTNKSKMWCGPAAIAAVTGYDTATITKLLRSVSGRASVRGVYCSDLLAALKILGYAATEIGRAPSFRWERSTLLQWRKRHRAAAKASPVIVNVTGHYVTLFGDMLVDNHTKTPVRFSKAPHRRKRVKQAWAIRKVGNSTWIDKAILPTSEKAAKRMALRLAKQNDIEIDAPELGDDGVIWVYGPDCLNDEEHDDPVYSEHYCDTWAEALERVNAYIEYAKTHPKECFANACGNEVVTS